MTGEPKADWDPKSEHVLHDQCLAYDEMRRRCPVAYSEFMGWSLFKHEDVMRVLLDPDTFSNAVSQHLSVPNGMDPPEHTAYRPLIEPYFSEQRMDLFEPACRNIVIELVQSALQSSEVELMADVALPFAARVQCTFLGWPPDLHAPLLDWTSQQYAATLAQDRQAMSCLAREFGHIIGDVLETRRRAESGPDADVTASLMDESVFGRPLSNEEIASVLRNWTVGEIGTISAAIGILCHFLATDLSLQSDLRRESSILPAAIDEILRIHGPLMVVSRHSKGARLFLLATVP
jgi:cytochrome P450